MQPSLNFCTGSNSAKFGLDFYSASALLVVQSAVIATGILSVLPSVCPSVTFRYCVQTNEDTIVRFLRPCMECRRGLAICLFACLFVRPSICQTRAFDKTEERSVQFFSERELMLMFAICRRPSVCRLSVVCLSSVVCNVRAPYSDD